MNCNKDLLTQKKLQLSIIKREFKKAINRGQHNWSDFHRVQHIKELKREIRVLQSNQINHKTLP
jgi:hypothetical protein